MNPNDPTQAGDQSGMGGSMPTDPNAGVPTTPTEEAPVTPSSETPAQEPAVPGTGDQNPGGETPVGGAPVV